MLRIEPMKWWLVANHMKHGMITVLKETREQQDLVPVGVGAHSSQSDSAGHEMASMSPGTDVANAPDMSNMDSSQADSEDDVDSMSDMSMPAASRALKLKMIIVSVATLAITLAIVTNFA
jgi:hypothetical protein